MSRVSGEADLRAAFVEAGLATDADLSRYRIGDATPAAVTRPETIDGVSTALSIASRLGAAVVPWGGGTRMGLGNPPSRYDVALHLGGLDQVVEHRPADLTVTVEAGCTVQALQEVLRASGQYLPLDPPLPKRATVGGTLATGFGGPLSTAFGLPRDLVIGMRAVLADGSVVKSGGNVVKNVTGYAMDRLYIGALGTLAVIAEATFKVTPIPRSEATVAASFASAHGATEAWDQVAAQGVPVLSAEVLNNVAQRLVGQPPREPDGGCRLLLRVAGRPSAVTRSVGVCAAICRERGGRVVDSLEGDTSCSLWTRVADLGWESGVPALALRLLGTPAHGPALYGLVAESAGAATLSVARGVAQACWDDDALPEDVPAFVDMLRGRAAMTRAAVVVESKRVWEGVEAWDPPGDGFTVMRRLKAQYDPQATLNPGRYVGGL